MGIVEREGDCVPPFPLSVRSTFPFHDSPKVINMSAIPFEMTAQ